MTTAYLLIEEKEAVARGVLISLIYTQVLSNILLSHRNLHFNVTFILNFINCRPRFGINDFNGFYVMDNCILTLPYFIDMIAPISF